MPMFAGKFRPLASAGGCALALTLSLWNAHAYAQTTPLRAGEAFVTRFSGVVKDSEGVLKIDPDGPVGAIIGLSSPSEAPRGQHWISKPIRPAVTAADVGQVFGVALDDQQPPNVYLSASAAFGLHRSRDGWMAGMWGPGGGPGTVWRLDAANGYRATPLITLGSGERPNSGASLGNIAFDRMHRQLFVSDMESGLIVRIAADGRRLSAFDHGRDARPAFLDAETNLRTSSPAIMADPARSARIDACEGPFDQTPACWNFSPSGRRIWGVGVRRDPMGEGARLYYSVWSSPAFADSSWSSLSEDDRRNAIWSVRLRPDGDFDLSDVRREFILPDFFAAQADIDRAGYSQPVSDIAFSECGERPVMLVSERGGVRNLGLGVENAFATPGEARTIRYELDQRGVWRPVGRYDVGNDDRRRAGPPFINANCAGGAAFGPDIRDPSSPQARDEGADAYVWITGDNLCSPQAPCNFPSAAPQQAAANGAGAVEPDPSQVHGVQGIRSDLIAEVAPPAPQDGRPRPESAALDSAYLVDMDRVIDGRGGLDEAELMRNDATLTGDIAVYQVCAPPPPYRAAGPGLPLVNPNYLIPPPPPGFVVPGHAPDWSHAQWASHGARTSHFRYGSHNPVYSHQRWRSHQSQWSHSRTQSHNPSWSHNRIGSHNRWISGGHDERRSHAQYRSHSTAYSHNPRISQGHASSVSSGHDPRISWHSPVMSRGHLPAISNGHSTERSRGGHDIARSTGPAHLPAVSRGLLHTPAVSSQAIHNTALSSRPIHTLSASRGLGHVRAISTRPVHNTILSSRPIHAVNVSRVPLHNPTLSRGPVHSAALSRAATHNPQLSRAPVHGAAASRAMRHDLALSRRVTHAPAVSRGVVIREPERQRPPSRLQQQPNLRQPNIQQPQRLRQPGVQQQRPAQQKKVQPRERRNQQTTQ